MKKKIYYKLFFLIFMVTSCNSLRISENKRYTKNFKEDFKQAAFCNCVIYGYNNKKITSYITSLDKSFYSPIIGILFAEELNKIAINEYSIIKKDSLTSIETTSEANAGKKVLKHCLNFYQSKKLDSITKYQYKKWKEMKNIDSLLEVKNPAF